MNKMFSTLHGKALGRLFLEILCAAAITGGALWSLSTIRHWQGYFGDAERTSLEESSVRGKESKPIAKTGLSVLRRSVFLEKDNVGFVYHPFIGITGAQYGAGGDNNVFDFPYGYGRVDYFGYRNKENLYFGIDKDTTLVVLSGNSEAVGLWHAPTSIGDELELELSRRTGRKYKVLNLAMNSYTTAHEIHAFVALAYQLRPQIVISHSFPNDVYYGSYIPTEFRDLGLFYDSTEAEWWRIIHAGHISKDLDAILSRGTADGGYAHTLAGIERNILKYRKITESAGARFIWGVQKFEPANSAPQFKRHWKITQDLYLALRDDLEQGKVDVEYIDFNRYPDIIMRDTIHTAAISVKVIAKIYADKILRE